MNYELKNEYANKRKTSKPVIITFTFLIILILIHIISPKIIPSFFLYITKPFWNIENEIRYGDKFLSSTELINKNDELLRELATKKTALDSFDFIKNENEELKAILGRKNNKELILAQVIKKPPFSSYDSLIVDIGEDKGLKKGSTVYVGGSMPIGIIDEVYSDSSKVKLYSTPGEKFTVLVGKKNLEITAFGKGAGVFEAELPRDAEVMVGDSVSIPALSDAFVGTVYKIVFEPSNPFSTVLFSQPININELRWVEVIKNN